MKLSYIQQGFGSALPIVLLHPYPLNAHFWSHQLSALSKNRHVIAPHFRGYGTSRVQAHDTFTIDTLAADIQDTLANAHINRAIFAGCSMGGYVLFELWRRQASLIAAMILADTRAEADTDETRARRRDNIERVKKTGTAELPETAVGMLSERSRENGSAAHQDVRAWAAEPTPAVIIKTLEMLAGRPDSTATLATITVPALILVGENDNVTPIENARAMKDGITDSSLRIIPDAGHFSPMENPSVVNHAIAEFVESPAIS